MPLIELKTNLKSLKYGRDQQGGGSSNQPYIESPIPEGYSPKSIDFLLRNGYLAPVNAGKDVLRLGKMFIDLKSINGPLFTIKQNLLSRTSVKPFATSVSGPDASILGVGIFKDGSPYVNQGVYLPTSTLLQAGTGFIGTHVKHLLLSEDSTYESVMKRLNFSDRFELENRLTALKLAKIKNTSFDDSFLQSHFKINNISRDENTILSYSGGPGSILGFGNTNIRFADKRTGENNTKLSWFPKDERSVTTNDRTPEDWIIPTTEGASGKYIEYKKLNFFNSNILFKDGLPVLNEGSYTYEPTWDYRTTEQNSLDPRKDLSIYQASRPIQKTKNEWIIPTTEGASGKYIEYKKLNFFNSNILFENGLPILNEGSYTYEPTWDYRTTEQNSLDPRKDLPTYQSTGKYPTVTNFLSGSKNPLNNTLDYRILPKETKYLLGDPGSNTRKAEIQSYIKSKYKTNFNNKSQALDRLSALGVGETQISGSGTEVKDIIDFKIKVKDGQSLRFRAFLESLTDNYSATWNSTKYVGRAENFYNYEGFERDINLSFNVYVQSQPELKPIIEKLNYLASITSPTYTGQGFMKGNIIELTIGKYIFNQPGILKQVNYEISLDGGWEINRNIQLPHFVKVNTFSFIPIHNFVPQLGGEYLGQSVTW